MKQSNIFYAIAPFMVPPHEFDLKNLGVKVPVRPAGFLNHNPTLRPVRPEDYDNLFFNMFIKIKPPSDIKAFLGYHLDHHIKKGGDPIVFLEHIKYMNIPKLNFKSKIVHIDILNKWIDKMEKDILTRHQNEKIAFVRRAYEIVSSDVNGPYTATLKPHWVAKDLLYDENTVNRILYELKEEGLIQPFSSDYSSFRLLPNVATYLLELQTPKTESSEKSTVINNHFNIKDSKNVNIANHSKHVNQQNTFTANDVAAAINDLKNNLDKFKHQIDNDYWILLQDKVDTLEAYQETESWDKSPMFQRLFRSVGSIIHNIPANVIANILTPATIELFNMMLPK